MIYYSVMLNNELEMLQLQFIINYNIVDKFIIIESNKTFSGLDKPYYFDQNKTLFEKYQDKIIHLKIKQNEVVEDITFENFNLIYTPYKNNWIREKDQREGFLKTMSFNDDDLIFFSDADEIVFLDKVLSQIDYDKVNYFNLIHCKYYINITDIPREFVKNANCCYPYKVYKMYKNIIETHFNIRKLDHICNNYKSIDNAGFHFSLCYNLKEKLYSFSHGEYNNQRCLNELINSKNSLSKNNMIEIPDIITKNIHPRFIYNPSSD